MPVRQIQRNKLLQIRRQIHIPFIRNQMVMNTLFHIFQMRMYDIRAALFKASQRIRILEEHMPDIRIHSKYGGTDLVKRSQQKIRIINDKARFNSTAR